MGCRFDSRDTRQACELFAEVRSLAGIACLNVARSLIVTHGFLPAPARLSVFDTPGGWPLPEEHGWRIATWANRKVAWDLEGVQQAINRVRRLMSLTAVVSRSCCRKHGSKVAVEMRRVANGRHDAWVSQRRHRCRSIITNLKTRLTLGSNQPKAFKTPMKLRNHLSPRSNAGAIVEYYLLVTHSPCHIAIECPVAIRLQSHGQEDPMF